MSLRDEQLDVLKVGDKSYDYYRIADLEGVDHLPYSLKVLVENLVRNIDGANITDEQVREWATSRMTTTASPILKASITCRTR